MTKALVTAVTRAPEHAVATTLAKEASEVHALGHDRITLDEMRVEHGIVPLAMDLTDREYVRAVAEGLEPDVLVHVALRWFEKPRFLELAEAGIDMTLEVNLSATLHDTRAVLPSMIDRGRGELAMFSQDNSDAESAVEPAAVAAIDGFVCALADKIQGSSVFVHRLSAGKPAFKQLGSRVLAQLSAASAKSCPAAAGRTSIAPRSPATRRTPCSMTAIVRSSRNILPHRQRCHSAPGYVDVARVGVFPTYQAMGGGTMVKFEAE